MSAAAPKIFDSAAGDLLLTVAPLLHVLRGDKRARLQRAFINTVLDMASRTLKVDPAALPATPHLAAKNLHSAVIELCLCAGVSRVDLVENFNDRTTPQFAGDLSESIERCLALLSVFHARRIETSGLPETDLAS